MDLVQKRQQLRQRQVEKVKKFRQSNMSASAAVEKQRDSDAAEKQKESAAKQKQREREDIKKEVRKEVEQETQKESMDIENSDGTVFARVVDIIGPSNMKPMVSNGVWKGTDQIEEGSLHKWFKGSKSKDGKGGWVNVVTGGTCASDEPGEGTPKCVSSSKRASMTKAERLSASRRKKKADPGQQSKSGAAKPTYVATDKKKKVNESKGTAELAAIKLRGKKACAVCGSFTHVTGDCPKKDHPVNETTKYKGVLADPMKEAYRVLASSDGQEKPSQFSYKDEKTAKKYVDSIKKGGGKATITKESVLTAIGRKKKKEEKKAPKAMDAGARAKRLLQRKIHAKYVSGSTENVPDDIRDHYDVTEKCWDGYTQKGMKKKGKKVVPNCVPVGEAKVEAGRSDYGKASVRNKRKFGREGEPAVFDASGDRGKMIDQRRSDHKAKRGVKEGVMDVVKKYRNKHDEKKPQKAQDAGAKARRSLQRREYASKVSGSTSNVPDNLRDHRSWDEFKKHI